jgi:hypothetical protein
MIEETSNAEQKIMSQIPTAQLTIGLIWSPTLQKVAANRERAEDSHLDKDKDGLSSGRETKAPKKYRASL